ncbi:hypothetical protein ACFSCX_24230 [Bacillus salitolerans]|uniref:GNAT family N-acetyltransferase n=1 Tax=Bacillus salitolerans TaxID=1437434 RepID=A0ABW4LWN2_9BACI
MELVACTKEEFEHYKEMYLTLPTWDILSFDFIDDLELCKIKMDGNIVGLIEFSLGMIPNSIHIDNLEVFQKGNRFGSRIIAGLKQEFKGVILELYSSSNKSASFWKEHQFKEEDDGTGTIILRYVVSEERRNA